MTNADAAEVQLLRAYIETKKREIQQAEHAYELREAAHLLELLARPLTHPSDFHASWKPIYLDQFYRDVAKFLISFVSVHLLPGFSEQQRASSFDVFFAGPHVPALNSCSALIAHISAGKPPQHDKPPCLDHAADEAAQVLVQSVRQLQRVLESDGVRRIADQLLHEPGVRGGRLLVTAQPVVSSLCSVPDLVYNRLQRAAPAFFAPRSFQPRLCRDVLDSLLSAGPSQTQQDASAVVFRMLVEKLARIGHSEHLLRAWLSRDDLFAPNYAEAHSRLLGSVPVSAFESLLVQLSTFPPANGCAENVTASSPQYRLVSLLPANLCANKQFQYVVAHKLLLTKAVHDVLFLRMLADTLSQTQPRCSDAASRDAPLANVFDVVVNRWSGDTFAMTADYGLNASITFFLRYAMTRLDRDAFADRDWTMKLCKGVQTHMAHSVDRVRLLGMRVGESVSTIMSPEQPLSFEISESDPVREAARVTFDFSRTRQAEEADDGSLTPGSVEGGEVSEVPRRSKPKAKSTKKKGLAMVDLDEAVISDDDNAAGEGEDEEDDGDGSDSDSDVSLDAYDLNDDEEDLKPQRPVYIKDLLAGLHAEDEREKTETALAEAELLLRRKPKDLHFSAKAVATALLRLEDKYDTPNFVMLRAKALAAACALSPANAVPYLQLQALEREQLLQSRLDVLQAMTAAAQELSETGSFRPNVAKNLLQEDIETRTMQGLKTRRFGYRRDPLAPVKRNAFADHALAFFSPLLFGYVKYARELDGTKRLSEVDDVFLAHLLHALASFVECAGHAPPAVPMAKSLMEFAWHFRSNAAAAVRHQVLYAFSRVLLVMPPFLLRQELGQSVVEMMVWLQETTKRDPDDGCREASRLLLSSGAVPMLTMP